MRERKREYGEDDTDTFNLVRFNLRKKIPIVVLGQRKYVERRLSMMKPFCIPRYRQMAPIERDTSVLAHK